MGIRSQFFPAKEEKWMYHGLKPSAFHNPQKEGPWEEACTDLLKHLVVKRIHLKIRAKVGGEM